MHAHAAFNRAPSYLVLREDRRVVVLVLHRHHHRAGAVQPCQETSPRRLLVTQGQRIVQNNACTGTSLHTHAHTHTRPQPMSHAHRIIICHRQRPAWLHCVHWMLNWPRKNKKTKGLLTHWITKLFCHAAWHGRQINLCLRMNCFFYFGPFSPRVSLQT